MADCWSILEIPLTRDVDEIRRARRALVRRWHPDTVEDPERKNEYTARCAAINVAHDEAVQIAQTAVRARRPAAPSGAFHAAAPADFGRMGSSDFVLTVFSPRTVLLMVFYLLAFRFTVPMTLFAVIFAAGVYAALVLDYAAHRIVVRPMLRLLGLERHWFLPWAILGAANVVMLAILFPLGSSLFQAGFALAIPLWRIRRWLKAPRSTLAAEEA